MLDVTRYLITMTTQLRQQQPTISSIITGGTFSPPAVINISLILPVMVKYPSSSTIPTSPEWCHPSVSNTSRVLSSAPRYPMKTLRPRMHSSPAPGDMSLTPGASLSSLVWNPGKSRPMVPGLEVEDCTYCHEQ